MNYSRLIYSTLILLASCATPPELIEKQARTHGFTRQHVVGTQFSLTLYSSKTICAENKMHIYIPGDGTPWRTRYSISLDPTPPYSLVLDLMAMDKAPSMFLGRPCYYGQRQARACHPSYWTHARYSETIVDSMIDVLKQQLVMYPICKVTLIGFSGGGTLAMLIAPRLPQVKTVITIAGNLDVAAWSNFHSYSPLQGSMNPAERRSLPADIKQWHLLGDADKEIPLFLVEQALQQQPDARILYFENFTHECCWKTVWPSILKTVSGQVD